LPGRQGCGSLCRALDTARAEGVAVRQHAFQRSPPRCTAHVAELVEPGLKQLEGIGVVERRQGQQGPEYHLTEAGREFAPIVRQLGEWGQRWFRAKFGRDELDVTLLMWDMRRCVKADAFPAGRISVQFRFSDVPAAKRTWWLVSDGEEIDLCPTDPGFEVGLYVATDLRTMTRVWMGDLPVKTAVALGEIELDGPKELRQRFEGWLGLSGFAGIKRANRQTRPGRDHDRSEGHGPHHPI
jgi:DNA-binding HxlR family transcriptional regulator